MLVTEILDAQLLTSPLKLMEADAALKHWELSCQFAARSLLLKFLPNDIFIHVKIQEEF